MTLNTTGSKVPLYFLLVSPNPKFHPECFALRPAIVESVAIFRQVHKMIPKRHRTLQGIYLFPASLSPKFQSMLLTKPVRDHFEANVTNDPKMTLNTIRSNVPHKYALLAYPSSKFHSMSLNDQSSLGYLHAVLKQIH